MATIVTTFVYKFYVCVCVCACVRVCRGYILDLLEGGRKLIVFGHHKSVLDSICECLHTKVTGTSGHWYIPTVAIAEWSISDCSVTMTGYSIHIYMHV